MAKVEAAIQEEWLAPHISKEGGFDGLLILDTLPEGKGSQLDIAGYHFPFMHEFVRPADPNDIRPRVVIDTTSLDIPIELLIGEEVQLA